MSVIARPRWTRQPGPNAYIDWTHPLSRGLVSALSRWMDHARRLPVTWTGTPTQTVRRYGVSLKGTDASFVSVPVSNLGTQVTVVYVGYWTKVSGPFVYGCGLGSSVGNSLFGLNVDPSSTENRWVLRQTNGGNFSGRYYSANVSTSQVNAVITGVVKGSSGSDIDVYWNGKLDNGTTNATSSSGNNTVFDTFALGGVYRSPANYAPAEIDGALALLFNRALTATEIAEISLNPYRLFAPQRQVSYFSATTGVTATLAPAQAADVAALGATVTNRASLAPTQAADTAALSATVTNRASIAATQAADIAALGATVTNRAQLAPTQAPDTAAINVVAGSLDVAIAATQAPDSAAIVVQLPSRTGAGASRRGKRRRIVLGDQVYDVLERDLPTLLEAVMLNRKPPATAVVEPAQPAARAQEKSEPTQVEARAPLPSLDEARERYEAMLADINRAATADVAALLQRVADRVLAELEDDEDAAVTLLLH